MKFFMMAFIHPKETDICVRMKEIVSLRIEVLLSKICSHRSRIKNEFLCFFSLLVIEK